MKDRFTYFEFQMYLLPGAILTLSIFIINSVFELIPLMRADSLDFLESILFLILSYIFGQVIQAHAHETPEERMKNEYWDGLFPTQRMFFPWDKKFRPIISEDLRSKLLDACLSHKFLTEEERWKCDQSEQSQDLIDKLETIISKIRYKLLNKEQIFIRINETEARYQALRGLFVSSFWSGILSILGALVGIGLLLWSNYVSLAPQSLIGIVLWGMLNLILWRIFRWRCRGVAQGFARELARAAIII